MAEATSCSKPGRGRLRWVLAISLAVIPGFAGGHDAPPFFKRGPDIRVLQNSGPRRILDLRDHIRDPKTPLERILFSIRTPPKQFWEGSAHAVLEANRYIDISPDFGWSGEENILVEANDGAHVHQLHVRVRIESLEAGTLIQAEDAALVRRHGPWADMHHWMRTGLMSDSPDSKLEFTFVGSDLALCLWGQGLVQDATYYRNPENRQPWSFPKRYRPGRAEVIIDGRRHALPPLSDTYNQGWTEVLVASGLKVESHHVEVRVLDGYVVIDGARAGCGPLVEFRGCATDPFGTPLSDILFRFKVAGRPDIGLRTGPDGKLPVFFGLTEGMYDVVAEPDSDPGFYRSPPTDECITAAEIPRWEFRAAKTRALDLVLDYDTPDLRSVNVIRRPLGTIPALIRAGEEFEVEIRLPGASPRDFEISLSDGHMTTPLDVVSTRPGEDMTRQGLEKRDRLRVKTAADLPEGLYDLRWAADELEDVAPRAVKILADYPKAYRFALMSDLHIRNPRANTDHVDALKASAALVSLLNPEFTIITGDITDCGSRPEYLRFLKAIRRFPSPTYTLPGNHDHYSDDVRYYYLGFDEYEKYLGRRFYDFRFGPDRFVCLDTGNYSKIPDSDMAGVHLDQWTWLMTRLDAAAANPGGFLGLFAHWDYTRDLAGDFPGANQFASILRNHPVDLISFGHKHTVVLGPRDQTPVSIQTGSLLERSFLIVEMDDSRIRDIYPVAMDELSISYSGRNDGTEAGLKAVITNRSERNFPNGRVQFRLMNGEPPYRVSGGRILRRAAAEEGRILLLDVSVNIPAGSTTEVIAQRAP